MALLISGCQLTGFTRSEQDSSSTNQVVTENISETKQLAPYTVHQYVSNLTRQLNDSGAHRIGSAHLAVTSFSMLNSLGKEVATQQSSGLSQQIQESLLTQFTQLGFKTVDHRLSRQFSVTSELEDVLTRDAKRLNRRQVIDYVLAGTLTRQEHAHIANARIIHLQTGQVIAAAHTEIPINVMWTDEKVQMRENTLYRSGY
jgi:TolB-like protein